MGGRFKPNDNFLPDLTKNTVEPATKKKSEAVLKTAQDIAPVDTGAYRDGLQMVPLPNGVGYQIEATVDYSVFVEFGTRNMPAHRTLGRALDAARDV